VRRAALWVFLTLALPGCAAAPAPVQEGIRGWHSTWDLVHRQLTAESVGAIEKEVFVGRHLSVHGLLVRSELGAPSVASAEILIVVDGLGVLGTTTGAHALEPGTVALLPAGARTSIKSLGDRELSGLLVRSESMAPSGGEVQVFDDEQAFPLELLHADAKRADHSEIRVLGALPGHLSARVVSVGRLRPLRAHLHPNHDELIFVLKGWGKLGVGGEGVGASRHYVDYPMRVRGVVVMGQGALHAYADDEGRTLAISIHGPVLGDRRRDTFFVESAGSVEARYQAFRQEKQADETGDGDKR
jgi:quercetin dioxygenase-like cupin family protein